MSTLKVDKVDNGGNPINFPNGFQIAGGEVVQGYTSSATEPTSPKKGDIWWDSANELLYQYINSEFKALTFSDWSAMLYDFTTHTFSPANTTGRTAPSITTLRNFYDVPWGDTYLNEGDFAGYQNWTVPETASYEITAAGASGASTYNDSTENGRGGAGAIIRTTFDLNGGDVITIVVGQRPETSAIAASNGGGGGGGGSFVWAAGNVLMLAAGGGSGGSHWRNVGAVRFPGDSASYTTSGGDGSGDISGGIDGNGGSASTNNRSSGAGGGWLTAGAPHPQNSSTSPGLTRSNGFIGGNGYNDYATGGGFGGGGGAYDTVGGGGGGYSGGAAGSYSGVGGGGGSYSSGTLTEVGLNTAPTSHQSSTAGYVTITKL